MTELIKSPEALPVVGFRNFKAQGLGPEELWACGVEGRRMEQQVHDLPSVPADFSRGLRMCV